ncbi:hypothetical protein ACLBWZ_13595 [Brucellaceae bacterium C25G]
MHKEIEIYQKKTKLLIGGFGMGVMAVCMIVALWVGPNPDSIFRFFRSPLMVYGLGSAGLILSLVLFWFALKNLLNPTPRIVISNDGLVVDGFSGRFTAKWNEFSGYTLVNNDIFVVSLKDLNAYISKLPSGRPQATAQALSARFGSPFLIETPMLITDKDTIQKHLSNHLNEIALS